MMGRHMLLPQAKRAREWKGKRDCMAGSMALEYWWRYKTLVPFLNVLSSCQFLLLAQTNLKPECKGARGLKTIEVTLLGAEQGSGGWEIIVRGKQRISSTRDAYTLPFLKQSNHMFMCIMEVVTLTPYSSCVWIFIIELVWEILCRIKSVLECLVSLVHIRRVECWSQDYLYGTQTRILPYSCIVW